MSSVTEEKKSTPDNLVDPVDGKKLAKFLAHDDRYYAEGVPEAIAKVRANPEFKANPHEFMKAWQKKRGYTEELRVPADWAQRGLRYAMGLATIEGIHIKPKKIIKPPAILPGEARCPVVYQHSGGCRVFLVPKSQLLGKEEKIAIKFLTTIDDSERLSEEIEIFDRVLRRWEEAGYLLEPSFVNSEVIYGFIED